MRIFMFSAWIFINIFFFGMAFYIYLILLLHCCKDATSTQTDLFHKKVKITKEKQVLFYRTKITELKSNSRLTGFKALNLEKIIAPKLRRSRSTKCGNNPSCSEQLDTNALETFKNKLFVQLRRVLHEESNVFKMDNPYFVNYTGPRERYQRLTSNEIKCRLKNAGLRLLEEELSLPERLKFRESKKAGNFLEGEHFETCAIVSSAGSLLNSKLGELIDQHDIVVRFNHAPVKNFEEDVGSKTTVRLVNSQVVTKKEFNFTTSKMYQNVTLVVWDPSDYFATLEQWFEDPDFNFFESWATQKLLNSKSDSFIIDPRSVWRVWDFIQSLTPHRIRKNPPSSGFLGLALLMPYCESIDFFEFIPSIRLTKKCHYFDDIEDDSCTFGVWHPLSAEKLISLAMNEANDSTVFNTGFIRMKGYRHLKC